MIQSTLANTLIQTITPYQEIFSSREILYFKIVLFLLILLVIVFGAIYYFSDKKIFRPFLKKMTPKPLPVKFDYENKLNFIRTYHIKNQLYREGCFEISATLKTFLETIYKKDVEEMTVTEIEKNLSDNSAREILRLLSKYQFQKTNTSKENFEQMCSQALSLINDRKRFLPK
ncbi:MAG: hypothetical protein L6Q54_05700 [Leptospiraceae bacterium]|nr:hypothetical protein [Leptospiraceae bacterium]MCK6380730.1 hypothetical protein [Leptospiraceae bacterium]NUM40289.1 hypothetical protein [Leptospiraceae bacterium]